MGIVIVVIHTQTHTKTLRNQTWRHRYTFALSFMTVYFLRPVHHLNGYEDYASWSNSQPPVFGIFSSRRLLFLPRQRRNVEGGKNELLEILILLEFTRIIIFLIICSV